jgi:hypothetical protein
MVTPAKTFVPIRGTDPQEGAPVECAAQHSTGRDGTIPSAKEKDSYGLMAAATLM